MAEKHLKARIILKHDTESNWKLATGFTPKKGEIIIYDIDDNYSYERIKIGDGETNVNSLPFYAGSWNDLKDIPFGDYGYISITWNKIISNEEYHTVTLNMVDGEYWHKRGYYYVSDLTPSNEDLIEGTNIIRNASEYPFVYSKWPETNNEIYNSTNDYTSISNDSIVITRKDNVTIGTIDGNVTFKKAGIYFFYEEMKQSYDAFSWYISEMKLKGNVRTLNEQLIPSSIARIRDIDEVKALIGDMPVSSQINSALSDVRPKVTTITLSAADWIGDSNPWSQVVDMYGVTENSKVDLQPTAIQIVALQNSDIALMADNNDGVITVYALGGKPTVDYTMQALITEVIPV